MKPEKTFILLLIYFVILNGYIYSTGTYFLNGFLLLITGLISLFLFSSGIKIPGKIIGVNPDLFAKIILVLSIGLTIILLDTTTILEPGLTRLSYFFFVFLNIFKFVLFIALILSLTYLGEKSRIKSRFKYLLLISLFLSIAIILMSPNPYIDTFVGIKEGVLMLFRGINPYANKIDNIPLSPSYSSYFSYWPSVLLFNAPFVFLSGDPRFTSIVANMITAIVMHKILKKNSSGGSFSEILPLIYLFNPVSFLIIWKSWIDPLAICLFTLFVYFLLSNRRFISLIFLALATMTRQNLFLVWPLVWKFLPFKKRNIISLILPFLILMLPFYFWNPADFINNGILRYAAHFAPRYDSLSLNTFVHSFSSQDLDKRVYFGILSLIYGIVFVKMKRSLTGLILSSTVILFAVFLLGYFLN